MTDKKKAEIIPVSSPVSSIDDQNKGEERKVAKNALVVSAGTLLSRIGGLARDQVIAYFFGTGMQADAFFIAWRIPNLLRRLLAEGALTAAFVPVFTEVLEKHGKQASVLLYKSIFTLMAIILFIVTVLGIIFAPQIVSVIAYGFASDKELFDLTVLITRIVFPFIFLMGLTAIIVGVLNSLNVFAAPAFSPFLLNIFMIFGALFISPLLKTPILGLAFGAMLGGTLQLLIQLPFLLKKGPYWGLSFNFTSPAVKKIFMLLGPATMGAAVYQISVFVNTLLATFLPTGTVSWLYYSDRLMQFPLGVFSVALGTAVLPALARQAATGNKDAFLKTIKFALGLQFFINIPAMVGLMVLSVPLLTLLFEHGEFGPVSTLKTSQALWAYAFGLPFLSGAGILVRVFYSASDTKTPTVVAAISLLFGVVMALVLMRPLAHVGLALASSLASLVNVVLLYFLFIKKYKVIYKKDFYFNKEILKEFFTYTFLALIMGFLLWLFGFTKVANSLSGQIFKVLGAVVFGAIIYLLLAGLFKCKHVRPLFKLIMRRIKAKKEKREAKKNKL